MQAVVQWAQLGLFIWLTLSDHYSVGGRVRGLLSVGPLVAIGGFSYSIYLLHAPLVDLCARALSATIPWTSRDALFGLLIVCLAPIVGIAWVFSIVLEKPFLGPPQKKLMEAQRRPAD